MNHYHSHEFSDVDSNVMLNETFDCNVDIVSFEYHREPSNAFRMTICERNLFHNDGTDRNANQTKNTKRLFSGSIQVFECAKKNLVFTWIRMCRTKAPFCLNDFLHMTH